ncbi:hypothetical protein D9M68_1008040 [compost metagenome]
MSAWNLIGDQAQVTTPAARVMPTSATTLPVKATALRYATPRESPARCWASWTLSRYRA